MRSDSRWHHGCYSKRRFRGRTAIEVTAADGFIHVFGEVSTKARIDYKKVIKDIIYDIGYRADELSMDGEFYRMLISINKQSPDIALVLIKRKLEQETKV